MKNCIGIDISKNSFDVHYWADGSDKHLDYSSASIFEFVNSLVFSSPELIVMEATGGYEAPLAAKLQAGGLPVAIVNPKQVRNFARAVGQSAKTDKIDARIIGL